MKKVVITALLMFTVSALFTGCSQQDLYIEPIFPSVESVNAKIESLGEVNDIKSAALVSEIIEDYQFLSNTSKSKINDDVNEEKNSVPKSSIISTGTL